VSIAEGSDGGGSIRIPSSCRGLVGIKPSRGHVSNAPNSNPREGLITHEPIARTFYDEHRPHQALGCGAPTAVWTKLALKWVKPPKPTA
jgi:Asp-tRNA(Asn)/Glu-tRNA(Gln) amidotransferase A subunit family amidase